MNTLEHDKKVLDELLEAVKGGVDGTYRVKGENLPLAEELEARGVITRPWKTSYPNICTARKVTLR